MRGSSLRPNDHFSLSRNTRRLHSTAMLTDKETALFLSVKRGRKRKEDRGAAASRRSPGRFRARGQRPPEQHA